MERLKVTIVTPTGAVDTEITQEMLERIRVQKEMLKEYGSDPMLETDEGDYLIVKDILIRLIANTRQ